MIKNYFTIAFRTLWRHRVYTMINVLGLGIGMAVCILVSLWVGHERNYDRFHEHADRLHRVDFTTKQRDYFGAFQPGPLAEYLSDSYPAIERASNYCPQGQHKISVENDGVIVDGAFVDAGFLRMFSFATSRGDAETALEAPQSIVLTRSIALALFGREDIIGETVIYDDETPLQVTAVLADIPDQSHLQFDYLLSTTSDIAPFWLETWDTKSTMAYVLLQEGTQRERIEPQIAGIIDNHHPEWSNVLYLAPIRNIHLFDPDGGGRITYVRIFSILAIVVLLIACINFTNLATARSEERFREIGIRKSVGSSPLQLGFQFLIEAILLSLIGLGLALLIVHLLLPNLNALLGIELLFRFDGFFLPSLFVLALITGLVAGAYPALYLAKLEPVHVLKGYSHVSISGGRGSGRTKLISLRSVLVTSQFAFSILFVAVVFVMFSQLDFIRNRALGYDHEEIVVLRTRGELAGQSEVLKQALLQNPGIDGVAFSDGPLDRYGASSSFEWEGRSDDEVIEIGFKGVGYDFLSTLEIEMVSGRFFSKEHPTDLADAIVINETAARLTGVEDPIGLRMTMHWGETRTIIGIVSDFHTRSLHDPITPLALTPITSGSNAFIRLSTTDLAGTLTAMERAVRTVASNDPLDYRFLDEDIEQMYSDDRRTGQLLTWLAVLTIFISCLGLFGLSAFMVGRRTREIGIRKVLGASVAGIVSLLSTDYLKLIGIAFIVVAPVGYLAVRRWLDGFAYRIDIGPGGFLLAGLLVACIALITVLHQSVRAAMADPVESLRYE